MGTTRHPVLRIDSHFLGATKQLPPLMKALIAEIPHVRFVVNLFDYHHGCKNEEVFQADLTHYPELQKRILKTTPSYGLHVTFVTHEHYGRCTRAGSHCVELYVDPLKFEQRPLLNDAEQQAVRKKYGLDGRKVILGGSLAIDELLPFTKAITYAREKHRDLCGIIVPRAQVRVETAKYLTRADMTADAPHESITFVTDVGNLADLYSICDTALIGDTLWTTDRHGGQNPLEPAFYGKRIVAGERWENNAEAFIGLRSSGLLTEVTNQHELNDAFAATPGIAACQQRAEAFIKSHQGAAVSYARKIKEFMAEDGTL